MTTPQVGVTHDVVLYAICNNLAPCGLVVDPGSYRVTNAPTFVPRLAMGSPSGADFVSYVSWVQDDWGGRSGANIADTHNYRNAERMIPTLPDRKMRLVRDPFLTQPHPQDWDNAVYLVPYVNTTWTTLHKALSSPAGSVPRAIHNVATLYNYRYNELPGGESWGIPVHLVDDKAYTETRIINGGLIYRSFFRQGTDWTQSSFAVCNSLSFSGHGFLAYDAVSYSTVAFISTYQHSTYKINPSGSSIWNIERIVQRRILAHCYNTIYSPAGTTTAGALAVYDGRLWRAPLYRGVIAYYQPEQTTAGYWSSYIDIEPGINIRRMCEFIGRLMIGATDGLYAYESGRSYKIVDLSNQISASNFSVMVSIAGSLWFNVGQRLWRYTSGGLLEELDTNFYADEFPVSLEGGDNCVFVLCSRRKDSGWHLYRIDTNTGATAVVGSSPDAILGASPDAVSDAYGGIRWGTIVNPPWLSVPTLATLDEFEVLDFQNVNKVGESLLVGPHVVQLDQTSFTARYETDVRFFNYGIHPDRLSPRDGSIGGHNLFTGHFSTGFITLGYPAAQKSWQRAVVHMTYPFTATVHWRLGYRFNRPPVRYEDTTHTCATLEASTWTWLSIQQAEVGKNIIDFPANVQSRQIELKIWVQAQPAYGFGSIGVDSVELDGLYVGPGDGVRRQHSFNAVIVDNLQKLNMEVDNSAAWITATLYSLADSGIPHVVAVPFPPPMGHTVKAVVELGPTGAGVPVMAYEYSCPGSVVAVTLREI